MNPMLTLPTLDPHIPLRLVPRLARERGARLARTLIHAGLVNPQTLVARPGDDHTATCAAALARWIEQRLPDLRCLCPAFVLVLDPDAQDGSRAAAPGAEIEWSGTGGTWSVGAALDALEALAPRLGLTVLTALEAASQRTVPLFTPCLALEHAIHCYWYGEDDETTALEEACGDDLAQQAALREEMVTRADFDHIYPSWALTWLGRRRPLSSGKLAARAKRLHRRDAQSVIEDVLALRSIRLPHLPPSDDEGWFVGFAGVLTWSEGDTLALRVVDDFEQMAAESDEYRTRSGSWPVRLDAPQDFEKWAASMAPWFEAVGRIDALIHKLSHGDWSASTKESA